MDHRSAFGREASARRGYLPLARLSRPAPSSIILVIATSEGTPIDQVTIRFCYCGASKDTPLCDKSFRQAGFEA
jgi:hypothetical protein